MGVLETVAPRADDQAEAEGRRSIGTRQKSSSKKQKKSSSRKGRSKNEKRNRSRSRARRYRRQAPQQKQQLQHDNSGQDHSRNTTLQDEAIDDLAMIEGVLKVNGESTKDSPPTGNNPDHTASPPNDDYPEDKEEEEVGSSQAKEIEKERFTRLRRSQLESQRLREVEAEKQGMFVKRQRVRYYYKAADKWYDDVVIVGVHFDDGPDKPYYTIRFTRVDISTDQYGNEEMTSQEVEKQTTPDRIERVPWDDEKSWMVLHQ